MALGSEGVPFTMPVQPAGTNSGDNGNNGVWGGDWGAFIVLFLLFGMFGWGGFGGWGGGFGGGINGGVGSEVQRGFDHSSVINKLDGITQGLCDGFYATNNAINGVGTTVMQGFSQAELSRCNQQAALMQQLNAMQYQAQDCCCQTQRAIDAVNYNLATQSCDTRNTIQNTTRDIIDNQNSNTRAIMDFLTQDKIATLTAENQSLKFQASQTAQNAFITANQDAQTAELIRRLGRDCPVPAYVVPNPNCCYGNPVGVNYGGCGGCGTC